MRKSWKSQNLGSERGARCEVLNMFWFICEIWRAVTGAYDWVLLGSEASP